MYVKRKDGFIFVAPSKRKGKKYDVYDGKNNKYIASFGAVGYQQYKDKIGFYKEFDHLDKKRRERYYKRHKEANYLSPKWFSHKYLW